MEQLTAILAQEFQVKPEHAAAVVELLDEGNTVPFIARYRKERHGAMDDQKIRELSERLAYLRGLEARKGEIKAAIGEQGKLTPELEAALDKASTLAEVEDLYRPYRPKRRTRAGIAREKGLEPLAQLLWQGRDRQGRPLSQRPEQLAQAYVHAENGVETREEALQGAKDILAEEFSDDASIRKSLRTMLQKQGSLRSVAAQEEDSVYRLYYDFEEPLKRLQSHRVLAINRGEKEGFLKVSVKPGESPASHSPSSAGPPSVQGAFAGSGGGRLEPAAVSLSGAGNPQRFDRGGRRTGHSHLCPEFAAFAAAAAGEEPGDLGL